MAVVVAHATGADAAEGQVAADLVQQGFVDAHPAGHHLVEHLVDHRAVVVEQVQRQRAVAAVDLLDGVVQVAVAAYHQDRAEDLVLHDRRVVARLQHQGRRQQALGLCALAVGHRRQFHHLQPARARIVQVAGQALVLGLVDDPGVVAVAVQAGVARAHLAAQRCHQFVAT